MSTWYLKEFVFTLPIPLRSTEYLRDLPSLDEIIKCGQL